LDLVRLSPSGDKIAYVTVNGEARQLFVRKVGGGALFVGNVGTSKIRDMAWAGEDYVLVEITGTLKFGRRTVYKWDEQNRGEVGEITVINVNKSTSYQMFRKDVNNILILGSLFQTQFINNKWYDFVYVYGDGRAGHLECVDLESGKYTPLPEDVRDFDFISDASGKILARAKYDEHTQKLSVYGSSRDRDPVVSRKSPMGEVSLLGEGRTVGTILLSEEGSDQDTIDEYPIVPNAAPTRLFDGLEVEGLLRDPGTRRLVGAELSQDKGISLFDPSLQKRFEAVRRAFPGLRVHLVSYSTGMTKIVVKTDGGDDPGTFWLIDMKTGKADDLMSAYPSIEPKDVGPTRTFTYKANDGLALEGVLTLPPGAAAKPLPLVLMPHGGPIGVHDEVGFDYWAQAFASRGYAVFQPNYRGSDGYGPKFRRAGFGEWGGKMLTDMTDGIAALAKAGLIDPKRVCIVGASYGGYAALAGVTIQKGFYRCAVAVAGVSDVRALMMREGYDSFSAGGRYVQAKFGAESPGAKSLTDISPIEHAAQADAPILMIHGKDDTVVPFVNSHSMQAVLEKAGKVSELLPLEGEDHWWSHEATRLEILKASVAFVQKYNPPS
jgi:dipeptidyl aminopeptidase/acylaminoacyl peptidase